MPLDGLMRPLGFLALLLLMGAAAACGKDSATLAESSTSQSAVTPVAQSVSPAAWGVPFPYEPGPGGISGSWPVPDRSVSAETQIVRLGDECFDIADDAIPDTDEHLLYLNSDTGGFCWGIYQFHGVGADDVPFGVSLDYEVSPDGQYWAGIADYNRLRWQWLPILPSGSGDFFTIPSQLGPVSPGGSIYLAVVVVSPVACAIQQVALTKQLTLPPPQALTASDGICCNAIYLDWTDPALSYPGLSYDGIAIQRALDTGGPWEEIGSVTAGETHFEDLHDFGSNNYPYNTPVYYRVLTEAGLAYSEPSLADTGFRVLGNVTNLTASDGEYGDGIHLSWGGVVAAEGYTLEYMNGAGDPPDWTTLVALPQQTSFIHGPATPPGDEAQELADYIYRVKANYQGEHSPEWSNEDQGFYMATPVAQLQADATRGPAPLMVQFNAGGSYDPGGGSITTYEWDWEGDGVWDHNSGSDPLMGYTYRKFGMFSAKVRVTDDESQTAIASLQIEVPGWVHTWGGASTDESTGVAIDIQGNIWVSGSSLSTGSGNWDINILKYSPAGELLLCKTWDNGDHDLATGIASDGTSIYISGITVLPGGTADDVLFLKYSTAGELLTQSAWDSSYGAGGEAIALDSSGNAYVVGWVQLASNGWEALILKYNSSGVLQWAKSWGRSLQDMASSCVSGDGQVFVAGTFDSNGSIGHVFLLRLAEDGALSWQKSWSSGANDIGRGVAVDSGSVFVCGRTDGFGVTDSDALLLRYSAGGVLEWQKTWGESSYEGFSGLVASGGLVFCTGDAIHGSNRTIPLVRFNSDGSCQFGRLFESGSGSIHTACGIAVDDQVRLYFGGQASDADGDWISVGIAPVDRSGTASDITGAAFSDQSQPVQVLSGTEGTLSGVMDTGGGDQDSLVMCYETLALE